MVTVFIAPFGARRPLLPSGPQRVHLLDFLLQLFVGKLFIRRRAFAAPGYFRRHVGVNKNVEG